MTMNHNKVIIAIFFLTLVVVTSFRGCRYRFSRSSGQRVEDTIGNKCNYDELHKQQQQQHMARYSHLRAWRSRKDVSSFSLFFLCLLFLNLVIVFSLYSINTSTNPLINHYISQCQKQKMIKNNVTCRGCHLSFVQVSAMGRME